MAGDSMKDFRGATHKDARHDGEHSLSTTPATPSIMVSLHNKLVVKHLPLQYANYATADQTPMQRAAAAAAEQTVATQASVVQADLITYIIYVFAFITLARPVTLAHLRFGAVSYPDLMIADEHEFFNRHKHYRYIDVELRIVKTGTLTTDVMTVRLCSYCSVVSEQKVLNVGADSYIQCPSEHLNVPQLFNSLLLVAYSAPGVGTVV
eukprot:TRINITY_DN5737_c0_g1_i5.p2 TRINITY_DN5737_c0_g1~~TRINITY_DN5737_c0_g1_i5.p2  ORF type:complete len:208 (+),score=48.05 TRINITY_DN5737_c0_g1_i5:1280-1903(+)